MFTLEQFKRKPSLCGPFVDGDVWLVRWNQNRQTWKRRKVDVVGPGGDLWWLKSFRIMTVAITIFFYTWAVTACQYSNLSYDKTLSTRQTVDDEIEQLSWVSVVIILETKECKVKPSHGKIARQVQHPWKTWVTDCFKKWIRGCLLTEPIPVQKVFLKVPT